MIDRAGFQNLVERCIAIRKVVRAPIDFGPIGTTPSEESARELKPLYLAVAEELNRFMAWLRESEEASVIQAFEQGVGGYVYRSEGFVENPNSIEESSVLSADIERANAECAILALEVTVARRILGVTVVS